MVLVLEQIMFEKVFASKCTRFECSVMELDICARKYDDRTELNSDFCPIGKSCDLNDVLNWDTASSSGDSLNCNDLPYDENYNRGEYNYSCGKFEENRNLAEGDHPKLCLTDKDCTLKDGSTTECTCSFGVEKYCTPAWDSSAFTPYWTKCKESSLDYDDIYYWILIKKYYSYTINTPDCAEWLITEFITMNEYKGLDRPVETGLTIGITIMLLLLLG